MEPKISRFRFIHFPFAAAVAVLLLSFGTAHAASNVNTGLPGSTCAPHNGGLTYAPPANGEATTGLGADAPAYYEIGMPTGAFAGRAPKGVMLMIHGGGWHIVGKAAVRYERPRADRWRERGWQTVNLDYRGCARSVEDVFWFMRRVRHLNPGAVICAHGTSAGGQLALLLASIRQDLACAITVGGPSDLTTLEHQLAFDPNLRAFASTGPVRLANFARAAFGSTPDALAKANPRRYVANVRARLLLASGTHDVFIPVAQNQNYAASVRAARPDAYVDVAVLPVGTSPFVHTAVTEESLKDLAAREDALVAPLVGA